MATRELVWDPKKQKK